MTLWARRARRLACATPQLRCLLALALACSPTVVRAAEANGTAVRAALTRSFGWLQEHPPDPDHDALAYRCLDATTWYLFAAFHPDAEVRGPAAAGLDRRLRLMRSPEQWTHVTLSYWAVVVRLMRFRGIDRAGAGAAVSAAQLASALERASPTTAWWTRELLRRSGDAVSADFGQTFVATTVATGGQDYVPEVADAVRLFHELVPATDLGQEPPTVLTPAQRAFAQRIVPGLIEVSRAAGDTDALAEALVAAGLLQARTSPAYRDGLAWMLTQQLPDGTYRNVRALGQGTVNDARHGVQVASWALLASLDHARPAVRSAGKERRAGKRP